MSATAVTTKGLIKQVAEAIFAGLVDFYATQGADPHSSVASATR